MFTLFFHYPPFSLSIIFIHCYGSMSVTSIFDSLPKFQLYPGSVCKGRKIVKRLNAISRLLSVLPFFSVSFLVHPITRSNCSKASYACYLQMNKLEKIKARIYTHEKISNIKNTKKSRSCLRILPYQC